MKWGIRKDRKSGGSSTKSSSKSNDSEKGPTSATKTASAIAGSKKRLESTSDRDLQTLLTRLNMERQLREFTTPQQSRSKRITSKIIEASGKGLLKSLTRIVEDVSYKHGTEYLVKKGLLDALNKKK